MVWVYPNSKMHACDANHHQCRRCLQLHHQCNGTIQQLALTKKNLLKLILFLRVKEKLLRVKKKQSHTINRW
jgi:hypothetical protein